MKLFNVKFKSLKKYSNDKKKPWRTAIERIKLSVLKFLFLAHKYNIKYVKYFMVTIKHMFLYMKKQYKIFISAKRTPSNGFFFISAITIGILQNNNTLLFPSIIPNLRHN